MADRNRTLFFGDNLTILRDYIRNESTDRLADYPGATIERNGERGIFDRYYHSNTWGENYPRIQILTIDELLNKKPVLMPPQYGTFKEAQRQKMDVEAAQAKFNF